MNYGFDFLTQWPFYLLMTFGVAALIPRAQYVAERIERRQHNPHAGELRPTLAQRACLFLPGLCALWAMVSMRSPWAAVILVAVYLVAFAGMIVFLRGPKQETKR